MRFRAAKKQSQFKANLLAFSVLRSADCVKIRKRNLKKQSQFAGEAIWRKLFSERILWQYASQWGTKKTKPITNTGSDAEWIPAFAGMTNMESLHGGKF